MCQSKEHYLLYLKPLRRSGWHSLISEVVMPEQDKRHYSVIAHSSSLAINGTRCRRKSIRKNLRPVALEFSIEFLKF